MKSINWLLLVAAIVAASAAHGGERTATLKVDGMTCPSCPYQVKRSLTGVEGVTAASVSLETSLATVTFEDSLTDVAALTAATAAVGFPSKPVE